MPGITKKDRPLTYQHFAEFADSYGKDANGLSKRKDLGETGRFRKFHISEIKERGYKLDVTWLKDDSLEDSDELPEPQDLATEAVTELEAVVDDLKEIIELLEKEEGADESLVESRLAALKDAPASVVTLDEMKSRLRSRFTK